MTRTDAEKKKEQNCFIAFLWLVFDHYWVHIPFKYTSMSVKKK